MLAMPIAPSSTGRSPNTACVVPHVTFHGPDSSSQIKAVNSTGIEVTRFLIENSDRASFIVSRLVGPNQPPTIICTGHKSSLSGTTTMNVHRQEVKYKTDLESYIITPIGKFKWRTGSSSLSGKMLKLIDEAKVLIAEANLKEMTFSVFVGADEIMLDCLLAGYIALVKAKKADASSVEWVHAGLELASALGGAGAGGGGGGGGAGA